MSFPVAFSIPSRPGEEFTSSNNGPLFERIISTPATFKPSTLLAFIATLFSSNVTFTFETFPPSNQAAMKRVSSVTKEVQLECVPQAMARILI
jgi:hypothetical protein